MYVYVLNSIMNTLQKIFVMVGVGSFFMLIIGGQISTYSVEGGNSIKYLFIQGYTPETLRTNWLAVISVFNIVVSSVGFFLFKDK